MSKVVLLLTNTNCLQQIKYYARSSTTSDYPFGIFKLFLILSQILHYFYQILTAFNKLKIMSDIVLLLPHTDCLQQDIDYVRDWTTSTKYWLPSTNKTLCQRLYYCYQVLAVFNKYWPPSISWRLCQRMYYFYQILTAFNKLRIMSEVVLLLPNTDRLQ